jgi:hypothetical protein
MTTSSGPSNPTGEQPEGEGERDASSAASSARLLRVRRPPPPRLIEAGEAGLHETPELRLEWPADRPFGLMRVGSHDLEAAARAVRHGARPTALVTGLGEGKETTARARRLTREELIAWLADPLLFRTALAGYRTARALQALDYTPGRDSDPYRAEEFSSRDLLRRVGRSLVGAQLDVGASGAMGGAFVAASMSDAWMGVNQRLLRIEADAAATFGAPFVGVVTVGLAGFETVEAQRLLVRSLAARRPAVWLLMLDGLSEDSGATRIVAALRLALLLQETGVPVILARAGDLRELFLAFGVAGVEFGLGRLLRFAVPDFTKSKGGPGPTPGPRFEMPSLCSSVNETATQRMLARELVAESACECPPCAGAASVAERVANAAEHDAHVVCGHLESLAGVLPADRVSRLDGRLTSATSHWRAAELDGAGIGRPVKLDRLRRALDEAVTAGLLDPEQLAAQLQLFD